MYNFLAGADNGVYYIDDIVKIITPLGYKGTAEYFIKLGLDKTRDEIVSVMNAYALEEYKYRIEAKQNVISVLKQLKKNGADLNVLTASPHSMLDSCLKRLGIFDVFTNVWSCDDFNTTKADLNIYKIVAEKIGKYDFSELLELG